jgi:hypothetical protein
MDYYLAFPDQATADAVLYTVHDAVTDEDGNVTIEAYVTPNYANIDTLGVIYKDDQAISGWHVNVRLIQGENDEALKSFEVTPSTPIRVWA